MVEALSLAVEFSGETSGCLYNQLDPLTIGEYQRALEIGQRYGFIILTKYMGWDSDRAKEVVYNLIYSYPSHESVIDMDEFKMLGFPADALEIKEQQILNRIPFLLLNEEESIIELFQDSSVILTKVNNNDKSKKVN
jgi:hypothetical protein